MPLTSSLLIKSLLFSYLTKSCTLIKIEYTFLFLKQYVLPYSGGGSHEANLISFLYLFLAILTFRSLFDLRDDGELPTVKVLCLL